MPSQKPATAGIKAKLPISADCSIAGINRLQIEAATITPAAKPVRLRCTSGFSSFFMKKTQAAPKVVPAKGINNPCQILVFNSSDIDKTPFYYIFMITIINYFSPC